MSKWLKWQCPSSLVHLHWCITLGLSGQFKVVSKQRAAEGKPESRANIETVMGNMGSILILKGTQIYFMTFILNGQKIPWRRPENRTWPSEQQLRIEFLLSWVLVSRRKIGSRARDGQGHIRSPTMSLSRAHLFRKRLRVNGASKWGMRVSMLLR